MTCPCPDHGSLRFPRRATTRRDVLRLALGGVGIAALGPTVARRLPVASGAPLGNKILVIVYLDGGCDTLNAVIPTTLSNYYSRRPTIAIPLANQLSLAGGPSTSTYTLHPELNSVRDLWNAGDVALVQRVGYPSPNLSHFESQDIYAQAVRNGFGGLGITESGWVARFADLYAPTPMGAVSIGMGRPTTFVGGSSNPLQVSSLSAFTFGGDQSAYAANQTYRLQVIQSLLAAASTTGTPGDVRDAIDQAHQLSGQVQTALTNYNTYLSGTAITYPNTTLGRNLKDVAALLHGGFETRVFYTGFGGFDLHGAEGGVTGSQATLLQRLDDAIKSFSDDMKNLGQWDNVVLGVFTEFGRRNFENGSGGTDHAESFSMMLMGGAVNGGTYGPDLTDPLLAGDNVAYAVDFRDVWREVVSDHLGASAGPVFPETQPTNTVLGVC